MMNVVCKGQCEPNVGIRELNPKGWHPIPPESD
jgi:hypothetical protein